MTKTFCDICDQEITTREWPCAPIRGGVIKLITEGDSSILLVPDMCFGCALDRLKQFDQRPKPALEG